MGSLTGFRRPEAGDNPPYLHEPYVGTRKRAPRREPIRLEPTLTEATGPAPSQAGFGSVVLDLTRPQGGGEAQGQRIIMAGMVKDADGRPVPDAVIEIWQANAGGRYIHALDAQVAALDPNFRGAGCVRTGPDGRYRFLTVKPGAYPWRNHPNAWRPQHIHFSVFGPGMAARLVTQMYFEGDPLLAYDPIYNSVPAPARERLLARFDLGLTEHDWALGWRFDFILRGRDATPMDAEP